MRRGNTPQGRSSSSIEIGLVDNNLVGNPSATITGRGTAHLVAKDAKNDLALPRLDTKPAAPLTPAVFRTTPLQLGEAVYVLGFPTAGALDHHGSPSPARAGEGGTTQA